MNAPPRLRSVVAVTALAAIGLVGSASRSAAALGCGPIEPGVGASLEGQRPFLDAPVQGGEDATGDRHVVVVQCSAAQPSNLGRLFELFRATPREDGSWSAASGAVFDLDSNDLRPAGWTSADAAGLPIFPGLVRYDEAAEQGEIRHALRFTAPHTRRAYVPPARHWASSATDPNLPPMGMRVRIKADYDISGFPPRMQVILRALQAYGMILADQGAFSVSGAPDERWDNQEIRMLRRLTASDFEVVEMRGVVAP